MWTIYLLFGCTFASVIMWAMFADGGQGYQELRSDGWGNIGIFMKLAAVVLFWPFFLIHFLWWLNEHKGV